MDLKPENILLTSIDKPNLKVAGMNRITTYHFKYLFDSNNRFWCSTTYWQTGKSKYTWNTYVYGSGNSFRISI
jgi:hypothetical protein